MNKMSLVVLLVPLFGVSIVGASLPMIFVKEADLIKHSSYVNALNKQLGDEQVKLQQFYSEQQKEAQKLQPSLTLNGDQITVEKVKLEFQTNIKREELNFQSFESKVKKEFETTLNQACEKVLQIKNASAIQIVGNDVKIIVSPFADVTKEVALELDKIKNDDVIKADKEKAFKASKGLFVETAKMDKEVKSVLADATITEEVPSAKDVIEKDTKLAGTVDVHNA